MDEGKTTPDRPAGMVEMWHELQNAVPDAYDDAQLSGLYHEGSKQQPCDMAFYRRINYFNRSALGRRLVEHAGKVYVCSHRHSLPEPRPMTMSLDAAIAARRSQRRFTGTPVPLDALSALLKAGNGTTGGLREDGLARRATPSGGGLYPTEVYLLPLDGALSPGAYHYDALRHELAQFHDRPAEPMIANACAAGLALPTASAALVVSGCFERQRVKYAERAYRFTLLEAGHVMQNLLLAAAALHLGALPLGGYIDDYVNDYLEIDGVDEAALYILLVGMIGDVDGG